MLSPVIHKSEERRLISFHGRDESLGDLSAGTIRTHADIFARIAQ